MSCPALTGRVTRNATVEIKRQLCEKLIARDISRVRAVDGHQVAITASHS